MKVIFYSSQKSPRLSYIIDFFSKHISDEPVIITNNIEEFTNSDAVKINYSDERITDQELWIQPHPLLFETGIRLQQVQCFQWNSYKAFFTTAGDIPFDIFAASFYLITRYEEYLPHEKDMYGRYAHTNSLAYKEGFLHIPIINYWIRELQKILQQKFSLFTIHHSPFTFIPTYDIDIAYAYLHRSFTNNSAIVLKELFTAKWSKLIERVKVLNHKTKDPFDTYQWLYDLHKKYKLAPYYFFLLAAKRKGYDKNILPSNEHLQRLIKQHAEKYTVGIHPSWQSGDDKNVLQKEIQTLKNITGKVVTTSRQHYIRMQLPQTYRLLIEQGITEDHSMGYGSINGFRASVAAAFYWYDLEKEQQTTFLFQPFCFMEANSFFEQHHTAMQAADELQQYHDIIKPVNGTLITIFHNHFVTEQKEWLPWRNMYANFLEKNF